MSYQAKVAKALQGDVDRVTRGLLPTGKYEVTVHKGGKSSTGHGDNDEAALDDALKGLGHAAKGSGAK